MPVAPTAELETALVSNERDVSVSPDPSRQQKVRTDDVISLTDVATEASRRAGSTAGDHRRLESDIDDEDENSEIFSSPCPTPSHPRLPKEHPEAVAGSDEIQSEITTTVRTVPGIESELDGHSYQQSDVGVPGGAQGAGTVTSSLALPKDAPVEEVKEVPVPAKMSPVGRGKTVDVDGNIKEKIGGVSVSNAAEPVHAPNSPFQSLPPSSEVSIDVESFQTDSGAPEESGDKGTGAFGIRGEGGSEFGIGSDGTRDVSSDGGASSPTSTQPSRSPHRPPLTDATSLQDVAALVDAEGMAAEQEFLEALQTVGRGENVQVVVEGGAADGAAGEFGFGAHMEAGDREENLDVYGTDGGAMKGVDDAETATRAMESGDTFSVLDGGGEFFCFTGESLNTFGFLGGASFNDQNQAD